MKQLKRLPIGIQTFSTIIEENMLYVDKTEYIWKMINTCKYIFLSRPRRFGKSLLISTLQAYFEGRRELFKGLAIEQLEKEWTAYPVLRLSMASGKHMEQVQLDRYLGSRLEEYESQYGISNPAVDNNVRLSNLIQAAYTQTGRKVVLLIDEYDAPLLDVVHEETQLPLLRRVMRNFYSPIKDCDPYLQFVFLTGITKFSQLSIFSELNNLMNISMDPEFAAICGITKEELLSDMCDYIEPLASNNGWTAEEATDVLRRQYDGYHFTWPSPDIFNPFSLLQAFTKRRIDNYWFASGTPTYLIEMMRKFDVLPSDLTTMEGGADDFDAPTENMTSILPLLYQSGYITIKGYDEAFNYYTLSVPNREVRIGLTKALIPSYVMPNTLKVNNTARRMAQLIAKEDLEGALQLLQTFLGTVPYCNEADSEGHYQQMLYIIFTLLSDYFVDVEIHTPTGRVDMVMQTAHTLYLFELKLNQSAESAMQQIDLKNYAAKFALTGLPIVKVGINFDTSRRTLTDWQIVRD